MGPFAFTLEATRFGVYPGDTAVTKAAGALLHAELASQRFGDAFDELVVDVHFRSPTKKRRKDIARHHALLDAMPKVTVRKKARRIEVAIASPFPLARFDCPALPSPDTFAALATEILRVLGTLRPKLGRVRLTASAERCSARCRPDRAERAAGA